MGKHKTKDRLFVTRTEHESHFGGKAENSSEVKTFATLPLGHCALTFQPCENPVCAPDGTVFEVLHILPYLKKFGKHPITEEPLNSSQLTALRFHKNEEGQLHCPILYKPFTEKTEVACIISTGNVYSLEAIKELNLKQKYLKDLLTGEPFKKEDIIILQTKTEPVQQNPLKRPKLNSELKNTQERSSKETHDKPLPKKPAGLSLTCTTWSPERQEKNSNSEKLPVLVKGYCTLITDRGELNLELDTDTAPKATRFFLLSLQRGCLNGVRLTYGKDKSLIRTADLQGLPGGDDKLIETSLKQQVDPFADDKLPPYKLLVSSHYRTKKNCHFAISWHGVSKLGVDYAVFGTLVGKRNTLHELVEGTETELVIEGCKIYVNPWAK
eukprot:jgi/Galph1/4707/GphlegSOOS_G3339.1